MTKNSKTFATARAALTKLADQLNTEAKADPRLAKTRTRCNKLVAALDMALKKYEVVHGRKVPAKIVERKVKAGAPKKAAKKRAKKSVVIADNVVEMKQSAAARKRAIVKRSR